MARQRKDSVPEENKKNTESGAYHVTESGLKFHHAPPSRPAPKNGAEYLERFKEGFSMRIVGEPTEHELVFEMIGVDVSFANALRRILISEVPTMAIESVFLWDNTSIIHDEVLAHRVGLVPLNVDARYFDEYEEELTGEEQATTAGAQNATDRNTIVFKLSASCTRSESHAQKTGDDDVDIDDTALGNVELADVAKEAAVAQRRAISSPNRPYTKHIYSGDLEWVPQGDQAEIFESIRPVHDDILLAKLRPGQTIEMEAHARKGIGRDHAKFSPVATAAYRLMPHIEILKPIYDELAEELVHILEPGVFTLVRTGSDDPPNTRVKAEVTNPYACTMSRNFMRNPELAESILMTRIADHVIFSVESVGMAQPGILVAEALRVLQEKCQRVVYLAQEYITENEGVMMT